MTVSEYISKLERSWPRNVPRELLRDAVIVVSKRRWLERKAKWYEPYQLNNLRDGWLCGHSVGFVDMPNFEALVPSSDAIHYVELGDYLIHDGALSHVTYVSVDANIGARYVDITPIADITYLG